MPYWAGMAVLSVVLLAALPLLRSVQTDVGETARLVVWGVGLALAVAWLIAVPWSAFVLLQTDASLTAAQRAELTRNRLTGWLAVCLRVAALLALAGLIDRVAWFMAFESRSLGRAGLVLAIAAAAIRALLPLLSSLLPGGSSTGTWLWVGRLAGYALAFTLCAWWVSLVDVAALGAAFQHGGPNFAEALAMIAALGIPALAYVVVTGRNLAFLNLSSLHSFYRARLARSYLGAANGKRFDLPQGLDACRTLPDPMPSFPAKVSIGDPQPDDDIALAEYQPHVHGGPVHLINVCINQTRDPRGGLFNQDRRGLALTVASGGQMQVSREGWKALDEGTPLTLGTWIAVSGAAIAPGLGSLTRGGIAALATFAGLRLGYWWDATVRTKVTDQKSSPLAKSVGLIRETFGVFRGTDRRGLVPHRWRALREHRGLCAARRARRGDRAGRLRRRSAVRFRRSREPGAQGPHRPAGRDPVPSAAAAAEPEVADADAARRDVRLRRRRRPTRLARRPGRVRLAQRPGLARQHGVPGAGPRPLLRRRTGDGILIVVKPNVSTACRSTW